MTVSQAWRFPAEWEAQDAVVLAWPHADTDWAPWLAQVEAAYVDLAHAILQRAKLILLCKDKALETRAQRLLNADALIKAERLHLTRFDYDDTWLRDTGPITLSKGALGKGGSLKWLDFRFTGWGGKYEASRDDQIVAHLMSLPMFKHIEHEVVDFALEGGAIESDGAGTLMSTWNCLHKRHPHKTQAQVDQLMKIKLASKRSHWLQHGELDGDDTDAHIDTLARFAATDCIVFQGCDDDKDPHYKSLQAMALELQGLQQKNGEPYRLVKLPWAGDLRDTANRRLAASYANFLILNGAVLMPSYGVETDALAASLMAEAFPGFEIVSVNCRPFIEQNGSLHCLTMQLPAGCISDSYSKR
jgi:agmatine/peptidylarginine deiminase